MKPIHKRLITYLLIGIITYFAGIYYLSRNVTEHFTLRAILIHESASRWGNAEIIRQWHKERGFTDIGYHAVILNGRLSSTSAYNPALDGKIEPGRPETEYGKHCAADGMNLKSLGVCIIGNPNYPGYLTNKQMDSLIHYCAIKCVQYNIPVSQITQHSDHDPQKPVDASLDMVEFRKRVQQEIGRVHG